MPGEDRADDLAGDRIGLCMDDFGDDLGGLFAACQLRGSQMEARAPGQPHLDRDAAIGAPGIEQAQVEAGARFQFDHQIARRRALFSQHDREALALARSHPHGLCGQRPERGERSQIGIAKCLVCACGKERRRGHATAS